MRFISLVFLLAFVGAVVAFAVQNLQELTLTFFDWSVNASVAAVVGAAYLLGMLSGWSILGVLRRSLHQATQKPEEHRQYAHSDR